MQSNLDKRLLFCTKINDYFCYSFTNNLKKLRKALNFKENSRFLPEFFQKMLLDNLLKMVYNIPNHKPVKGEYS